MSFYDLENRILLVVERFLSGKHHKRPGLVTAWDSKNHLAKVMLQPIGVETGWIKVHTMAAGNGYGLMTGLTPGDGKTTGDQVEVTFQEGDIETGAITARLHSKKAPPPQVFSGEHLLRTPFGTTNTPHHIYQAKDGSTTNQDKAGSVTKHDGTGNITETSNTSNQTNSITIKHSAAGSNASVTDSANGSSAQVVHTATDGSNTSTLTASAPSGINAQATQTVTISSTQHPVSISSLLQSVGITAGTSVGITAATSIGLAAPLVNMAAGALGGAAIGGAGSIGSGAAAGGTSLLAASNGTTTPGAGAIGQRVTNQTTISTEVALSGSGGIVNVANIALTAGVWDIWGTVYFDVTFAQPTTTTGVISATTASLTPYAADVLALTSQVATEPSSLLAMPVGRTTITISASTTFYLNASATFSSGATAAYGIISALRIA